MDDKYKDLVAQGISLMAAENYEAAAEMFLNAIGVDAKEKEAYEHLGNAYANLEKYDDAITAFRKITYIDKKNGEAFYSIGSIYVLLNDKEKAIENYNKAENLGYKNSQMYEIMATIFLNEDDPAQALRNINRAISMEPLDAHLRLFKIRIYLAYDKFEEALDALEDMEKVLPDAFEIYDLKSQIYAGRGELEKALNEIEKGLERFPQDAGLALLKLRLLVNNSRTNDAKKYIEDLKKTGKYEEQIKEMSILEATLRIQNNEIDTAQSILEHALIRCTGDEDLLYLLLDLNGKTGRYENVIKYAEPLLEIKGQPFYQATAMYFKAVALEELGKKEDAAKAFKDNTVNLRRMTIEMPYFYEGYLYRLLSHTKLGEYAKALELADYIENLYPEKADSHAFKYFIYKEMGNMEMAEEEKTKAKAINSELIME